MNQSKTWQGTTITVGVSTLIGTVIGLFLVSIGVRPALPTVVVSACIGLVAALTPEVLGRVLVVHGKRRALLYFAGIPIGALVGAILLVVWLKPDTVALQRILLIVISVTVVLGGATASGFYLYDRQVKLQRALHAAELRQLEAERQRLLAQLKMLQAQIEPHFLFNTLANVTALIGTDPALARRLLEQLIVYLRATLARSRSERATLADEVELLRSYLDICRIRMGDRLSYIIEVPAEVATYPFPPMLLQPLVENAVKHGLEPKLARGELRLTARRRDGRLYIDVCDNGVGFVTVSGAGTGIANVRERLAALYGDAARLQLEESPSGGVTAKLELPA